MRVPALALLLSRMPARLPSRLARRGARPEARIRGSAVGSYSRSPVSLIDVSFPDGNLLGVRENTPRAGPAAGACAAGACATVVALAALARRAHESEGAAMMRHLRTLTVAATSVIWLLGVTGCSSLKVVVDRDSTIPIPPGSTWAWGPEPPERRPDELDPRVNNTIIHGRVKRSVEAVLAQKGFRQVDDAQT